MGLFSQHVYAEPSDSAKVYFRQGKAVLDTAFNDNARALTNILEKIQKNGKNTLLSIKSISITGAASPEGPVALNHQLSEQRAQAIYDYLSMYEPLPDSLVRFKYLGRDWQGLRIMVEKDMQVPYRPKVLSLLSNIAETATPSTEGDYKAIEQLRSIGDGAPYHYLYSRLYPVLRESGIIINYAFHPVIILNNPGPVAKLPSSEILDVELMENGRIRQCKPFYMGLKTNMLYDALALPNIGAEFYLGRNISVGANWLYGWWDKDNRHRYWRAYGGDLYIRLWFGNRSKTKPLMGHHIGIFGGILTYDFEFGGKGYMGGIPGRTLWDRSNRFVGVEYGYSLPIARRINIDFTLGMGYFGGKYIKYIPKNNEYIWQSTHRLKWFGPIKAEVSLVWLIGCDNYNRKGGAR